MPTSMMPHLQTISTDPALPTTPFHPALVPTPRKPKASSVDSLIREIPMQQAARHTTPEAELDMMADAGPGIFMGLRVALFFNAGLGIVALLTYETWTMLAR